jgi:Sulfatase-modifying factor enzyme 1
MTQAFAGGSRVSIPRQTYEVNWRNGYPRTITVDTFSIDAHAVSFRDWAQYLITKGTSRDDREFRDHFSVSGWLTKNIAPKDYNTGEPVDWEDPVTGITLEEARQFCSAHRARLPGFAELLTGLYGPDAAGFFPSEKWEFTVDVPVRALNPGEAGTLAVVRDEDYEVWSRWEASSMLTSGGGVIAFRRAYSTINQLTDRPMKRAPVGVPARSPDEVVAAAQILLWHIDRAMTEGAFDRVEHLSVLHQEVANRRSIPPEVWVLEREIPVSERTWGAVTRTIPRGPRSTP